MAANRNDRAVASTDNKKQLPVIWKRAGEMEVIRSIIAPNLTDVELVLFSKICDKTGLDPFAHQIYAIPYGKDERRKVSFQIGIDGYRLIAERSGRYEGQTQPEWYDPELHEWVDVWVNDRKPPAAARVGVYKAGFREPVYGLAHYDAYAVGYTGRDGMWHANDQWTKNGAGMLAKCAEAQAIRKAFPEFLSGLYSAEEMEQARVEVTVEGIPVVEAETGELPPEEVRGFGKNNLTWEQLIPALREALGEKGMQFNDLPRIPDWPNVASLQSAVREWADRHSEEDVVEALVAAADKARGGTQQEAML